MYAQAGTPPWPGTEAVALVVVRRVVGRVVDLRALELVVAVPVTGVDEGVMHVAPDAALA